MAFTVAFEEVQPYPRSLWQDGVFLGTRQLKCAWADRLALLTELDLPANRAWPYPDGPSDALIFKTQLDSLGKQTGPAGTEASYDWAVLTCWYHNQGPVLYGNKDLITESIYGDGDAQTVSYDDLRWAAANNQPLKAAERPPFRVYGLVFEQIFHQVTSIEAWVYLRMRRVNPLAYAAFVLPYVFPAQTMLYQPASIVTTARLSGLRTFNVVVRYLIHPSWADWANQPNIGWNTFWRVSTARYEPLYLPGGGRYIQYPAWTI